MLEGTFPVAGGTLTATDIWGATYTGYTATIRHLLALFHRAALLITNDGGPGQFAALTPVPTILLFGPETPLLYGPLAPKAFCFHLPFPCSPCLTAYNHRNSPCDGDNQCLKVITPESVLECALGMLGEYVGKTYLETKRRPRFIIEKSI